ncbi:Hypothetical predicted protein [Paramuricea clavata]|uniref:Uncharacterized protein n=1 Tax=Paramuricea clavata TaxID=317549 RepID=A0A6S7FUB7_PARCT|nr:Hypothetical predicted protein [Paramuricea clavata]
MGKSFGQELAFVHFFVTEMRVIWVLWYTIYNTIESIVVSSSLFDAYRNSGVTECLHEKKITAEDIEDCAQSAYRRYLATGPQVPYERCNEDCSGSGIGVEVPEPRNILFFITVVLFVVMESRSLLLQKSDGFDINSEKFCAIEICHGNWITWVINFFFTSNAVLLDEMEVQVMKKGLPGHVAAADEHDDGCSSCLAWQPLSDQSLNEFLATKNENIGHQNNGTV